MSIFISYSHQDKDFVDKLATSLVTNRVHIFLDRWEMNVGDSITNKIQEAITEASFLLVILSKASVDSDWCKREITSGLMLELELKRVVVLPVLLEDCSIPLFLKDKLYADFRKTYGDGLKQVLTAVARLKKEETGRLDKEENYFTDFATSWGKRGDYFEFHIDVVDFSILPEKPYTVLTNVTFVGNKAATKKFDEYASQGKAWLMKNMILLLCAENKSITTSNAHLLHDQIFLTTLDIADSKTSISFKGFVTIKRLGIRDGKDKLYYFGRIFELLWNDAKEEMKSK